MTENNKPQGQIMVEGELPAGPAPVLVYATYPTLAAAEAAGKALLSARLAGCVNILPGMVSLYSWQGELERAEEAVMIVKTVSEAARTCMEAIRKDHPYDMPAILLLPVTGGSAEYLSWVRDGTQNT